MRSSSAAAFLPLALALVACGGAALPAPQPPRVGADPPVVVPVAPANVPPASAAAASAPPAAAAPAAPARPADAEAAARAFFTAFVDHDPDAAARVADDALARGQTRVYADVTGVDGIGEAKPDLWPHLPSGLVLYEATLTRKQRAERVVVAIRNDPDRGFRVVGLRNLTEMDEEAAARRAPAAAERVEAKGKLLTKPTKGSFRVELGSTLPPVGEKAELYRMIDRSIPLIGGGWVLIADAKVSAVTGRAVTLEMLEEKAKMKVNGKKLDHFTPGVPVILKWQSGRAQALATP